MIVQRTKTYAVCPSCGADAGTVDHLLGQVTKTMWYCDACGQRYSLDFKNGAVEIAAMSGERKIKTTDLLVLPPQDKPVYFIVEGIRFEDPHFVDERSIEHAMTYYYEEHSCPTNWLQPEMVYHDGNADPHGLVKFVATRDSSMFPPDEPCGPNAHDDELIKFIEEKKS